MPRSKKQQNKKTSFFAKATKDKKKKVKVATKKVIKKTSVKKAAVKKMVKKMVKKIAAKKQAKKKSVSKFATKPAVKKANTERVITLADLFDNESVKNFASNNPTLSQILEESVSEVRNEEKSKITLAELFSDEVDQKDFEISLADLFETTEETATATESVEQENAEMITLADLFENFDWDKVVSEVQQAEVIKSEQVVEPVKEEVPTTQMFHSVAIPHFWRRPKKEPSLIARLFAPQMMATVGITMVSLFFVSMWFQTTRASIIESSIQDPAMSEAWEAVKDGYYSIQTEKQQVQKAIDQLQNSNTPVAENNQQLLDAQNAFTEVFSQAVQQKLNQTSGGTNN